MTEYRHTHTNAHGLFETGSLYGAGGRGGGAECNKSGHFFAALLHDIFEMQHFQGFMHFYTISQTACMVIMMQLMFVCVCFVFFSGKIVKQYVKLVEQIFVVVNY